MFPEPGTHKIQLFIQREKAEPQTDTLYPLIVLSKQILPSKASPSSAFKLLLPPGTQNNSFKVGWRYTFATFVFTENKGLNLYSTATLPVTGIVLSLINSTRRAA